MSEPNSDINAILDKIKKEYKIDTTVTKKLLDGKEEFTFSHPGARPSALTFEEVKTEPRHREISDPHGRIEMDFSAPAGTAPATPAGDTAPAPDSTPAPSAAPATPSHPAWRTYIPRFTEVSETYRISSEPRPARTTLKKKNSEEDSSVATVDTPYEKDNADAVVVKVGTSATEEHEGEIINLQKPDVRPAPPPMPTQAHSRTLAQETSEIRELIGNAAPTPEAAPARQTPTVTPITPEPIPDPEPPKKPEPKAAPTPKPQETPVQDYTLPDPEPEIHTYDMPDPAPAHDDNPGELVTAEDARRRSTAEYTSYVQRMSFKDRFLDTIISVRVRFVAASLLSVFLLVFENLSALGVDVVRLLHLESLPMSMAWLDLELIVCLFALVSPEIVTSGKQLFSKRQPSEWICLSSFVISVLYYVAILFLHPAEYPLFGFLFALSALSTLLSSLLFENAEFMSFKLTSIGGMKSVVEQRMTRTLGRENLALDGAVDEYKSKTARVFRTSFVSDFFVRNRRATERPYAILLLLALLLAASLIAGAAAYFIVGGLTSAVLAFATVYLVGAPAFSLMTHRVPYYHAELEALAQDSTVVGESSYYDYAGVDVITFDDTEIFGHEDVALKRMMLYGDNRAIPKVLRQMASLFAAVGGPLEEMFSSSLEKKTAPADRATVEADGVAGYADGVLIHAGTESYMQRHGILIPVDATTRAENAPTTRVMYAAEGGKVYAKFFIRYSFSEEFTMMLPLLRDAGIVPLIYTRDPNIDAGLLSSLTMGAGGMRVMKKFTLPAEETQTYPRLSSGIVTLGDKTNAVNMILLTKRYVAFQKTAELLRLIACGTGVVFGAVLAFVLPAGIPSLIAAALQIAWITVFGILSKVRFSK